MLKNNHTVTVTKSLAMNAVEYGAIIGSKGELASKIIRFQPDERLQIGRDDSQCDVVLLDSRISRVHLEMIFDTKDRKYKVTDHSSNGTIVDGKYKLVKHKETVISSGSKLWLGSSENEIILG